MIRRLLLILLASCPLRCAIAQPAESGSAQAASGGVKIRRLPVSGHDEGKPGFSVLPGASTGVTFSNVLSQAAIEKNRILENGSGVALGDVDGDGLCDIYLCRLEGDNALYRNLGGWRFQDVTQEAGVACSGQYSTGAVLADVDGDGDLDLLVNSIGGGTRLFLNDGKGRFTEATQSGLIRKGGSHSIALADIDGDGDLDIYVANYRATTFKDIENPTQVHLRQSGGKLVVPPEYADQFVTAEGRSGPALLEIGEPDGLYLNDGGGRFTPVPWSSGTFTGRDGRPLSSPPRDWSLTVAMRDLDGDGVPDIYVCSDFFSPDRIWINDGKGHFRPIDPLAVRKTSWACMSVDFADIDRDGVDDFMTADMLSRHHVSRQTQRSNLELEPVPWWGWPADRFGFDARPQTLRNVVQLGRGDGTYAEVGLFGGLSASEWTWGLAFLDVDLDGYEDLLAINGHPHDMTDSDAITRFGEASMRGKRGEVGAGLQFFPKLETANLAFRNRGDLRFEEVGKQWGFDWVGVSQGMALGDLDGDGDLDVVVNNLNGPALLCRNNGGGGRVAVRLKGKGGNTHGIGAKIVLRGGAGASQSQEIMSGGRYLSSDDSVRVFATGARTNGMTLEVRWRAGGRSMIEGVEADCEYEIDEAGAASTRPGADPQRSSTGVVLFEDASPLLKHRHVENHFDDFERQPLLPRRLSQGGPGVAWMDVDGDGKEDLVIGSGAGGNLGVYVNRGGDTGFGRVGAPAWQAALADDVTGIVGWSAEAGSSTMFVGKSSYESGRTNGPAVVRYDVFFGEVKESVVAEADGSSVGGLAVADIDGDGDLDLFVGGCVVPGKYPSSASSRIFRNDDGKYTLDVENTAGLSHVGLVNGAVWTDLDGDGLPDLVLACDWGLVRVFANQGGHLSDATEKWGLKGYRGWWTGVASGDFDGDGRMDLVVGNWGLNNKYRDHLDHELRVYHGDVDADGRWEVFEAYWDAELGKEVPWVDLRRLKAAAPVVGERFARYVDYAQASMSEILGPDLAKTELLKANTLETKVFLNCGGVFQPGVLPFETQLAPVFSVSVGDVDGDGKEDILLSQNFFATDDEAGRYDAGRALVLRGDGKGGFEAVKGQAGGVKVYGEQRGAALGDFDEDGRLDWVVTQNGAETRLLRNVGARPGLRVRLAGDSGNGVGIGCTLRLGDGKSWGPAREVHGGSGYWSQDSVVQVMSTVGNPAQIQVRWPGGRVTTGAIPAQAHEIRVHVDGQIEAVR